jgi:uncharacterized protein YndB with AHSA1/START domain
MEAHMREAQETFSYQVSRDVPAGPDAAWAAWTDPVRYGEWFGAVPGSVVLDVRTGGSWSLSLPVGEQGETETMTGEYGEVITKELLTIITHFDGGDTEMEFRFEPTASGTRITVRQSSPSSEQRDGSREGAEMLLTLCAEYLARGGR